MIRLTRTLAVVAFAVVGLLGISWLSFAAFTDDDDDDAPPATLGSAGASEVFPFESLTDWVSYANQVSVVTIVAEEEIPPPAEVLERREGYVGRTIVMQIDETVWTAKGANPVSGQLEIIAAGWLLKGDKRYPIAFGEGPRHEVGSRYLIALAQFDVDTWGVLTSGSTLPLQGDRVPAEAQLRNAAAAELAGKTVDEIAAMLAATERDPLAVRYWHLEPTDRIQAVWNDRFPNVEESAPDDPR